MDALAVGVVVFVHDAFVQAVELVLIQLIVDALPTSFGVAVDEHSRKH